MVTQQELRELLHYDPETGHFTWIKHRGRVAAGSRAGSIRGEGYEQIMLGGKAYQSHRLAWLWTTGEWPATQVDHRNGMRNDNRWENLRLASHAENQWNTGVRADNASGFKGVSRPRGRAKWQAHINEGGRRKYLGSFDSPEEAAQVASAARQATRGEFAR